MDSSLPGSSVLGVLQTKIMRVNPRLGDCVLGLRGDTCSRGLRSGFCRDDPQEPSSRVACWQLLLGGRPDGLVHSWGPVPWRQSGAAAGWGVPSQRLSPLTSTWSWGPPWPRFSPLLSPALYSWSRLSFLLLSTPESASLCLGTAVLRSPKLPRQRACGAGCIRAPRTSLSKLNEERHRRLRLAFPI